MSSSTAVWSQLWILGLFPLTEHIAWSSSFPYIYAMVESFNTTSKPDYPTGLYASLLVSCFTFGEFLMAPQWARISDTIGRKPTLLIGSLGSAGSAAAFGLSTSLPMALVARLFAGAVNPNLGVLKTYVAELVSKEQQARGFSSLYFMAGLGFICGPVIGGYLAEPTRTMPSIFPSNSIWDRFPYFLPNLVILLCLSISCVLGMFFLEEVHPAFRGRKDFARRVISSIGIRPKDGEASSGRPSHAALDHDGEEQSSEDPLIESPVHQSPYTVEFRQAFTRQIVLQILSLTLESFKDLAALSLVPIFLASPQPPGHDAGHRSLGGGFGLNTENTSTVLLTQAIASIVYQVLVIPRAIEHQGALRCYRLALVGCIVTYTLLPMSLLLQGTNGLLACTVILCIQALWFGLSGTAAAMMITNNCPSPAYLATINGVAASCGCLAKTIGPALIGTLYDKGVEKGNVLVPFWTLGGVALIILGLTAYLREQL